MQDMWQATYATPSNFLRAAQCQKTETRQEFALQVQVYQLKVTIDLPEGMQSIWRKIEIRGDATLVELADAIQASFDWGGIHKHEFVAADESWKATSPQYGPPEFDDSYQNEEEASYTSLEIAFP